MWSDDTGSGDSSHRNTSVFTNSPSFVTEWCTNTSPLLFIITLTGKTSLRCEHLSSVPGLDLHVQSVTRSQILSRNKLKGDVNTLMYVL